jgi:hypothetical protein
LNELTYKKSAADPEGVTFPPPKKINLHELTYKKLAADPEGVTFPLPIPSPLKKPCMNLPIKNLRRILGIIGREANVEEKNPIGERGPNGADDHRRRQIHSIFERFDKNTRRQRSPKNFMFQLNGLHETAADFSVVERDPRMRVRFRRHFDHFELDFGVRRRSVGGRF